MNGPLRAELDDLFKLHQTRRAEIAVLVNATEALQEYHDAIGRLFRRP